MARPVDAVGLDSTAPQVAFPGTLGSGQSDSREICVRQDLFEHRGAGKMRDSTRPRFESWSALRTAETERQVDPVAIL